MNKTIPTSLTLACMLSSCAIAPPAKPYRYGVSETVDKSQVATIWVGNAPMAYMMIKSIDGQSLPERPYSVMLKPGKHTIGLYLRDLTDLPALQGGRYGNLDLQIDVLAAHDYAIWHKNMDADKRFEMSVEDLGTDRNCRYETIGKMRQGYIPVYLDCPKAK